MFSPAGRLHWRASAIGSVQSLEFTFGIEVMPSAHEIGVGRAGTLAGMTDAIPTRISHALGRACILLMLAVASIQAQAAPVTFDQALEQAGHFAPSIAARQDQVESERLKASTARQLPDPKLEAGIQDFPVTGPNAFNPLDEDFSIVRVGVSQNFPNPAKRRARVGRAQADIVAAQADVGVEVRDVRIAAGLAWTDLYFARRKLAVLSDLDKKIDDLAKTVRASLTSSAARPSDAVRPGQLKAEVADRRSTLEASMARARAILTRFTGDPSPEPQGLPPEEPPARDVLASRLERLPRLLRLDGVVGQAEADVRLAQSEKRPDWSVNVSYGKRNFKFGDLLSVGVTVDLPIFARKRQDPIIAARAREVDGARREREAALQEIRAKLDSDLADHQEHHELYVRARDTLVPLAAQRARLDLASYAAGRLDIGLALSTTLDAAKAELDLLDREAVVVRDAVLINLTYGS